MLESQFKKSFVARLNSFSPNLATDINIIKNLDQETIHKVISFLISSACQAQSFAAIMTALDTIDKIDKEWLSKIIENIANETLDMHDDYEYRRLFTIYYRLDKKLAKKLIDEGLDSHNIDIVEAAQDLVAIQTEEGDAEWLK